MRWYKIVDKDKQGNFKMLFHGINGSKIIPVDTWISSIQDIVSDGSRGTKYLSGWHVMNDLDECREYLSKFTDKTKKRVIVEIEVRGAMWPKRHSPSNVFLCEEIRIIGEVL